MAAFSAFRERKRHTEDHTALLSTSGLSFSLLYETPISFYLVPQIISLPTFPVFSSLFLFRKFKALKICFTVTLMWLLFCLLILSLSLYSCSILHFLLHLSLVQQAPNIFISNTRTHTVMTYLLMFGIDTLSPVS